MFGKDFIWGAGTSSYQIEGAAFEADKGLNVWDVASHQHGLVLDDHNGDIACDHYHRYLEDVKLIKSLGIKNYRFSINWARLIPNGVGKVSETGKNFYLSLLKALKEAGITPWVTIYCWEYPYALYRKGGWENDESPDWFVEYAKTIVELFDDYIDNYILINEPESFIPGHHQHAEAPFVDLPVRDVMKCAHNTLLSCARGERIIRKTSKHPVKVGITLGFRPRLPYTPADLETARKDTFGCKKAFGVSALWSDPLVFGKYPDDYAEWMKEEGVSFPAEQIKELKCNLDFIGFNTYTGDFVTNENGKAKKVPIPRWAPRTAMNWTVYPESIYYSAKFLYERYGLPLICTENGTALSEWKDENGEINDDCRIDYVRRYLKELSRAAEEAKILGYFYWSLMDNFEWGFGFTKRFGLIYIDYETLERTPKKSAYWYKKVMETNGSEL